MGVATHLERLVVHFVPNICGFGEVQVALFFVPHGWVCVRESEDRCRLGFDVRGLAVAARSTLIWKVIATGVSRRTSTDVAFDGIPCLPPAINSRFISISIQ